MPDRSLDALLTGDFGIPKDLLVHHGRDTLLARVRAAAPEACAPGTLVLLTEDRVRRGTLFDLVGRRVAFPEGAPYDWCHLALVDPDPGAAWSHPAWWAFIPAEPAAVVLRPTPYPAHPTGRVRLS